MKKWKDRVTSQKGFSVIEVLCTVVITVAAIAVFMVIANSYAAKAAKGTDSLMMKSAEKIAAVNLNANDTIFSEPGEAVTPPYTGYFDDISNKIVKEKPRGYNQYSVVESSKGLYSGSPNTLVIQVQYDGESLSFSWVEDH